MHSMPTSFEARHRFAGPARAAPAILLLAVLLWVPASQSSAEKTADGVAPPIETDVSPEDETTPDSDPDGDETTDQEVINPCAMPSVHSSFWLDRLHDRLWWSVCGTARWFDGFFGDERFPEELLEIQGQASVDVLYDEYDGWDFRGRFRVKWPLPNLDHRVNTYFGRDNEDVITDRDRGLDLVPGPFSESGEQDWLIGLGYHPTRARRRGDLDIKVGIKLRFPLDPFLQVRYWRRWFLGDTSMFRFRQTLFWRNRLGFGSTTNLEIEHFLGKKLLVRWRASGTVAEIHVEGWEWSSSVTVYQGINYVHAIAYRLAVRGETKDPETLEEYGFSVTYRRRYLRDWFFAELVAGVTWPRELLTEEREPTPHLGFGFEIEFGRDQGGWRRFPARLPNPLDYGKYPPPVDPDLEGREGSVLDGG